MDYSWLDKLPRIDKDSIPEPVKYWALYAKSFYENFLELIDNPRRLKKATLRKLDKLDDPEARDALLFFFRIRRDEIDGIDLWESLKSKYTRILNESPDMIEADNLKIVKPGTNYLGLKDFQFPFGYYNGKMRIGKLMGIHPDIYNVYQDMQGFSGRMSMDYSGRVWIHDKVISFWDYPPTKEKLLEIIKDIEEEYLKKFKQPLYINPNDWYIEVIDKRLNRKSFTGLQFKDWDDAEKASLIKIKDYKGSGEWSEEKRTGPHIAVPRGNFGSKHPKYHQKQKEKRYMFSENYIMESLDDFILNEDAGNLSKFKLPKTLMKRIINTGWNEMGGRESEVIVLENPADYKELLKDLKQPFLGGVISVDNEPMYFFYRESERKFHMYDIENIRKSEEESYQRQKERQKRIKDAEAQKQNENLNEARGRRGYYNYDPGDKGSFSTQTLSDFIKKIDGEVTIELIKSDSNRQEINKKRRDIASSNEDPLASDSSGYGWSSVPKAQKERYKKYATKKRLQIDKRVEDVKDRMKEQIMTNFDKALDKVIDELRRGYDWYAKPENIGKALMDGVNFDEFRKLAKAYDAVEPGSDSKGGNDAARASRVLKQTGYL